VARGKTDVPPAALDQGLKNAQDQLTLFGRAMAGDMVMVVTPATGVPKPTGLAWTQDFYVELRDSDGEIHTWFNKTVANQLSVGDTSLAGVASISPAANAVWVDGTCKVTMSGTAAAWLNGDTATLTVAAMTIAGQTLAQKTGVLTFTT